MAFEMWKLKQQERKIKRQQQDNSVGDITKIVIVMFFMVYTPTIIFDAIGLISSQDNIIFTIMGFSATVTFFISLFSLVYYVYSKRKNTLFMDYSIYALFITLLLVSIPVWILYGVNGFWQIVLF